MLKVYYICVPNNGGPAQIMNLPDFEGPSSFKGHVYMENGQYLNWPTYSETAHFLNMKFKREMIHPSDQWNPGIDWSKYLKESN